MKNALLLLIPCFLVGCFANNKHIVSKQIKKNLTLFNQQTHSFSGFSLYDPTSKQFLVKYNDSSYFVPASNTKILTLYSVLKTLKDSVPAIKYAVRNDTLYFAGTGDPTFLDRDFSSNKLYQFLNTTKLKLTYLPAKYLSPQYGPGWSWDDYNADYSPERCSFPIYGNTVNIEFSRNKKPQFMPLYFQKLSSVRNFVSDNTNPIQRNWNSNNISYNKSLEKANLSVKIPFHYTDSVFLQLLTDTLKRKIEIGKASNIRNWTYFYSTPTDSMLRKMMHVSDNFIAEQSLILCSGVQTDTLSTTIAIKQIKKSYFTNLPDAINWSDGSGLSRYTLITPRTLVAILSKVKENIAEPRLLNLFAVGGKSGTIKSWYKKEPPYVFAKTGTLSSVHCLSGFVRTRKGNLLIFSFMHNNFIGSSTAFKQKMEEILEKIYATY